MMKSTLSTELEQVAKEKGLEKRVLIETLEAAILMAAKKTFGSQREIEARWNEQAGVVRIFLKMVVVEESTNNQREISLSQAIKINKEAELGDEYNFEIFYREDDKEKANRQDERFFETLGISTYRPGFGRIAAQAAKQVIYQRVREAERDMIFSEYKDRKGELATGIVRRFERGNIIVDLGRTEAILPVREQAPRESYRAADRIQAYIKDIDRNAKGPQIILSRTDPGLLIKLFEMEVPEIDEGIVRIEAAAREPGARSKIAVSSRDSDVDPVGACVGMRGSRVQSVVQELKGEKIDIVPFSMDSARFVCNAIQPAEVSRVIIDEDNRTMELIVPQDQLSLAIGRRGQNVRLAAQLTGWRLDIISEAKVKQLEEEARVSLSEIETISEYIQDTLFKYGYHAAWEVAEAKNSELAAIPGFTEESATRVREMAKKAGLVQRQKAIEQGAQNIAESLLESQGILSETQRLMLVKNVSDKLIEQLRNGGYNSVEQVLKENDAERLSSSCGISVKKAKQLRHWIEIFKEAEPLGKEMAAATMAIEGIGKLVGIYSKDAPAAPGEAPSEIEGNATRE
jgi:N utilization substance protein A